jgi:hypothetical protein
VTEEHLDFGLDLRGAVEIADLYRVDGVWQEGAGALVLHIWAGDALPLAVWLPTVFPEDGACLECR